MIVRRLTLALAALALFLAVWAFWWEPRRLVTHEVSLALPCWRGAPLRVAVVGDLHIGSPGVGVEKLDRVVATINAGHPDLIVLLGDYVIQGVIGGHFVPPETTAAHLAKLKAPLGVYAVLGNHDWWLDATRVRRALESNGIPVIDDRAVPIRSFWLAGVSDFMEGKHDPALSLRDVPADATVIAITHDPDVFPEIPQRVCLTLAAHTHGGQVALPFIGRPVVPSIYKQRYAYGPIREHEKQLFVTSGVGTSIVPVRFRVVPEIVFLTLRSPGIFR